jgi:hypothetical protein
VQLLHHGLVNLPGSCHVWVESSGAQNDQVTLPQDDGQ